MAEEKGNKRKVRYKKKVLNLDEFLKLSENQQYERVEDILNYMYENTEDVNDGLVKDALAVCFSKEDNKTELPNKLEVKKSDSVVTFIFKDRSNLLLFLLFLLGFLLAGLLALYAGYKYLNSNKLNIDLNGDGVCDLNCDLDGDGKCDINCDTNGDKKPDYNIDYKGNKKVIFNIKMPEGSVKNPVNQDTNGDGKCDLNCDTDNDGWPDANVDTDGDGKCDINCDTNGDGKCDTNCDTNGDGKCDLNCDTNGDGKCDLNCDTNGDGKCDTNCDTNGDGKCDTNCDTNGDGKCDLNCDTNGDGKCDTNCDTNGDGKCDTNCDTNGDGKCDLNCDTNGDGKCDTNCDTNGDGVCDLNCDDNGDGKCDRNCNNGGQSGSGSGGTSVETNVYLDIKFETSDTIVASKIYPDDQPGDVNTKIPDIKFTVENLSDNTLTYDIRWLITENTFTSNNFWYKVVSDNGGFNQDWITAPKADSLVKSKVSIAPRTKQSYTISLTLHGTGSEQNYDQGKRFNGRIMVELSK